MILEITWFSSGVKQTEGHNAFLSIDGLQNKGQLKGQCLKTAYVSVPAVTKTNTMNPVCLIHMSQVWQLRPLRGRGDRAPSSAWILFTSVRSHSKSSLDMQCWGTASTEPLLALIWVRFLQKSLVIASEQGHRKKGNAKSFHSIILCKEHDPPLV